MQKVLSIYQNYITRTESDANVPVCQGSSSDRHRTPGNTVPVSQAIQRLFSCSLSSSGPIFLASHSDKCDLLLIYNFPITPSSAGDSFRSDSFALRQDQIKVETCPEFAQAVLRLLIYGIRKEVKHTVNKGELVAAIASDAGLTNKDAGAALNAVIVNITKALKKGDTVTLVGFGTFSVVKRKARMGRNPQTGEAIKIKAAKVPKFKAGARLKAFKV